MDVRCAVVMTRAATPTNVTCLTDSVGAWRGEVVVNAINASPYTTAILKRNASVSINQETDM